MKRILRDLWRGCLSIIPEHICISDRVCGKHPIADPLVGCGLEFNLSHAANSSIYSFTKRARAGINTRPLSKGLAWWQLARAYPRENRRNWLNKVLLLWKPYCRRSRCGWIAWILDFQIAAVDRLRRGLSAGIMPSLYRLNQ